MRTSPKGSVPGETAPAAPTKPQSERDWARSLKEIAKGIAFRYTSLGAPSYPYPNLEPIELATLINEIERLKDVKGNIAEVGVARGMTTRFLCEHIVAQGLQGGLTLYAVDTFSSFTARDLDHEIKSRGKSLSDLKGFRYNSYDTWKQNFAAFGFVKAVQGDCATLDYSFMAPLKMAFLDVDLYLPTMAALPRIYQQLAKGGVLLVDDVRSERAYDGACQAYLEFCAGLKIEPRIIGNKCGAIYKA